MVIHKNIFGFSVTDKKPHENWPSEGIIVFDKVSLAYSKNDPPVLKCVSFTVRPSEKVIIRETAAYNFYQDFFC